MIIKGKYNEAIVYANIIEQQAIDQIKRMCDYECSEGSKIRIMPDVHYGAGCTIGTTMTINNKAVPNIVGIDIGCGMYTINLGKCNIDFEKLDKIVHDIPNGKMIWEQRIENPHLERLKCYRDIKDIKRLERSLGTLGGGNHFIEIDISEDGTNYLIIHTGSRNLGKQVAEIYQRLAIDLSHNKDKLFKKKKEIIKSYKEQGRKSEIEEAIKQLYREFKPSEATIPPDIAYLFDEYLDDYLHDIIICQEFASRNREIIADIILNNLNITATDSFHTIHNYIDTDSMILRKGAVSAQKDEKILIPINMRDGSILAYGKGDPEWNYSAPHGAGRIMSRSEAKSTLNLEEYKNNMSGVYSSTVNQNTLDESPMAYKSLNDIINVIDSSVKIIEVLKPIYNFKSENDLYFGKKKNIK